MSAVVLAFALVLPWVFVALGFWVAFQLVRQNGRILLHLESLEQRVDRLAALAPSSPPDPSPAGLPLGSPAPEFVLPSIRGGQGSLADFRGRPALLVFFNPGCGFCVQMAGDLAALPPDGAGGRPVPVVVSTGDPEENRLFFDEHGIRGPVFLQREMEVAAEYSIGGTPMGYLVDGEGRIASELAIGANALLALAGGPEAGSGRPSVANRSLSESRLRRDGLPAGTLAPGFRLPALDGGELSLKDYRGKQVLLVFSDPHCGPCEALAPQLEQAARERPGLQVLMVSRGDPEENRAKVAQHGLTFPVALQKKWEISRKYAMFATPVGYLIDAAGVTAAEVAIGAEAILALAARVEDAPGAEGRCRCGKPGCGGKNCRCRDGKAQANRG